MKDLLARIHEMKRLVLLLEKREDRVNMKLRIARAEAFLYEKELLDIRIASEKELAKK